METALIWGAGGGIGRAITSQLAKENWQILVAVRHLESSTNLTKYVYDVELSEAYSVQSAITAIRREVSDMHLGMNTLLWVFSNYLVQLILSLPSRTRNIYKRYAICLQIVFLMYNITSYRPLVVYRKLWNMEWSYR